MEKQESVYLSSRICGMVFESMWCRELAENGIGLSKGMGAQPQKKIRKKTAARNPVWVLAVLLLAIPLLSAAIPQGPTKTATALSWAYGTTAPLPPAHPLPLDSSLQHLPGSNLAFTLVQIHDHFDPADWHPEDHGPMPGIVAHGRKPAVEACAFCHYANGQGRSQNAALAGLPSIYFVQQMMDFKSGDRKSTDPLKANAKAMIATAKAMSDEEIKASADYFSALTYKPWIKVIESATAPKTRVVKGLFLKLEGSQTEPIGNRIIEVPDSMLATEVLHDDHSGFTAYVPPGSVKKGEMLATNSGGSTVNCGVCHGSELEGDGAVPPLAGRSPSYIARQIHDIQTGARNGTGSPLMLTMQEAVANLTPEEIVAISAYIASLPVPSGPR